MMTNEIEIGDFVIGSTYYGRVLEITEDKLKITCTSTARRHMPTCTKTNYYSGWQWVNKANAEKVSKGQGVYDG